MKYFLAYSTAILFVIGIYTGYYWLSIAWMYVIIQIIDLISTESFPQNTVEEESDIKKNRIFDILVWLVLPMQYLILGIFLYKLNDRTLSLADKLWLTGSYGICAAIYGINVAHELGHRTNKIEQWMAKLLLLSTQYTHFFIEHNYGHHKHVGTPEDGATARKGESVYSFFIRSLTMGYNSAWNIESKRLRNRNLSPYSFRNEMIVFTILQFLFVSSILFFLGEEVIVFYLIGTLNAIFLLEAVNYIQHYGLQRIQNADGSYEKYQLHHSWNSNYPVGRMILFELSRHSDHHDKASKKYQLLKPYAEQPQLPTGYPGMVLLSFFPPLFFRIMNPLLHKWNS